MTLTIPGHVMANIVSYMSFDDLAKMAQVSRAWQTYAYGSPLWHKANWEPQARGTNDFCDSNNIVPDARHIGIPTQLCFLSWALQQNRVSSDEHECDPVEYTDNLKREWLAKKRPCMHVTHHLWHDVFNGAIMRRTNTSHHQWRDVFKACRTLRGLSQSESDRLESVLITYPKGEAPYRAWLERRIAECAPLPFPPPALLTIPLSAQDTQREKYRTMNLDRYTYIVGCLQNLVNRYQESADSLGHRLATAQMPADHVVEALTDAIAFSCPPSPVRQPDPIE